MRWKSDINICGEPYVYDKYQDRQYWTDELYLIACMLNHYEDRIDELESHIHRNKYGEIPTKLDDVICSVASKIRFNFPKIENKISQGDGWEFQSVEKVNEKKYLITVRFEEDI